jgi:hypothetical protein
MSEWWTYELSDFLLFSPRTYYRLFELYNVAIWPLQILAIALGLAIAALWGSGRAWAGRVAVVILAACWLLVAYAYLLERYDTINWAAGYFAAGFAIEALLLIATGLLRPPRLPRPNTAVATRVGFGMFLFALFVQPLVGPLLGRPWLQMEIFGVAPDPMVLATLGVLLAADRSYWALLAIPLIWCAISGATLWAMQSPDALIMPAAAVLVLVVAAWKTRKRKGRGHEHPTGRA